MKQPRQEILDDDAREIVRRVESGKYANSEAITKIYLKVCGHNIGRVIIIMKR